MSSQRVQISEIDSARFGISIARVSRFAAGDLPGLLAFCRENQVRMLIARCKVSALDAAQEMEEAGGRIMDTLVYFDRRMDLPIARHEDPGVRLASSPDAAAVGEVAAEAFRGYMGHYHADPRLDRAKCDAAYASWAARSCSELTVASRVLVAERDDVIAGFLTLINRSDEEQEIVLNGVRPIFQRQGVYGSLMGAALAEARADGAKVISVSTQLSNIGVQRTWCRLGFEPRESFYTFHLWSS